jgi:hypothetical protein
VQYIRVYPAGSSVDWGDAVVGPCRGGGGLYGARSSGAARLCARCARCGAGVRLFQLPAPHVGVFCLTTSWTLSHKIVDLFACETGW